MKKKKRSQNEKLILSPLSLPVGARNDCLCFVAAPVCVAPLELTGETACVKGCRRDVAAVTL